MKTYQIHISKKIIFFFLIGTLLSCGKKDNNRILTTFSSNTGTKWLCYPLDSNHSFYAYTVKEFFSDGNMLEYVNNKSQKKLEKIPKSNLWNPEKWFIINDSTVSVESVYNPQTKYYHKFNRKILYYNKDSIILQGTKENNYSGVLVLKRLK